MEKQQIAARIDRLSIRVGAEIGLAGKDKAINAKIGAAVGVSQESVRQWRAGDTFPRLERLGGLCEFLKKHGVEATPELILFGITPKSLPSAEMRERIADEGPELELLRIYRAANRDGQAQIVTNARALMQAYPRPSQVVQLSIVKKHHKK